MQTELAEFIRDTPEGREADAILRKCVHCGFCTATCPTYQVLGDDLDSPRGRIYLIKRALEGAPVSGKTRLHLDRCLTCRACETTCPSGVRYGRLVDIGRAVVEARTRRSPWDRLRRGALAFALPRSALFKTGLRLAQAAGLQPRTRPAGAWPGPRHVRRMLVLRGCVQPALAPSINAAAARVLDRVGVSLLEVPGAGCCGGIRFHLNDQEYAHLLAIDANYRGKAERVTELTRDLCEVIQPDELPQGRDRGRVAFHSPCTLQHGQQLRGKVEALLTRVGYEVAPVRDAHLCCGSAGTYSLLEPQIAGELRLRKLAALEELAPQAIATANIGCLVHLQGGAAKPVRHWIELLDAALA
jgi:glycolate oxidase iron-sulfur subunit